MQFLFISVLVESFFKVSLSKISEGLFKFKYPIIVQTFILFKLEIFFSIQTF